MPSVIVRRWRPGETTTAAEMNTMVRDNLNWVGGDTGWITPTLANSWVSFDGGATYDIPQYRRFGQIVYIKGLAKNGTTGTTIFTLPVGYRPLRQRLFLCEANGGRAARVDINASGQVSVFAYITGGSNADLSLEIKFVAEQ